MPETKSANAGTYAARIPVMFTTTNCTNGALKVCIVLASGRVVGTGYAMSPANAYYFACVDARDAGFADAAAGHAREASGMFPDDRGLAALAERTTVD
jgi:hypothetical protein